MRTHARVVVIGGGAVGTSILYHLAEAGITDTVLLEKDELTSGSTWHAAGNIPTYANNWLGMRAGNYAWQLYKDLGDKVGAPITYRHTGAFWPAHTQDRMDLFRHLTGVSKSAGFELAMITPAEMEELHPYYRALSDQSGGVIGGIFDPYEGDVDPSQLTQALAKGARDKGAEIVRFAEVIGIERSASGAWSVRTSNDTVQCETIINAAGFYGAKVGQMAGADTPVTTLQHQYLVTEPLEQLESNQELFPLIRDPEIRFYLRRERSSLLLGSYAHAGRVAWTDGPPNDFSHQLFPDALDDLAGVLEETLAHVPLLAEAGVQRCVNGPIAYAPDAQPLVGPAAGVPNFYHATGVQIGITHSAAIGKAMAEWLSEGETEWDLAAWDPRRFGEWAAQDYAGARASEHYGLQYAIPYPHRIMQAGRPVNRTPLHKVLGRKGAIFGQIGGWERAFWFDKPKSIPQTPDDPYGHLSFRDDEPWRKAVRIECETVRDHVGIMDHGGFTKFEVEGPGAEEFLNRIFCGAMPAPGRARLSYMLTPKGRVWSEATIAHLAPDRFLLCGPTLAVDRDFDWLAARLPDDHTVTLRKGCEFDAALMLMGPRSRQLLSALTDTDISASAQPWMSVSEFNVGGVPVIGMRISYVGELGWELHARSEDLENLHAAIRKIGDPMGLSDFGSYALNVMRIEKGYHGWGSDFGTEYTPFDAGLERFIAFNKPDFVGRDAVLALKDKEPEWMFCGFEIDSPDADALPSDPILNGDDVVGYVTSATFGYRTGKRLALGYLATGPLSQAQEFDIEILGVRRKARRHDPRVYDPENNRLKA